MDLTANIQLIIDEYCKIINTKYRIHLNNDDIIDFTFKGENLPHLLGLQHLVDIPIFEKYSDKTVTASYIFKCLKNKTINIDEIYASSYFEQIYQNKLKHFNISQLFNDIKIIKFNPELIKNYDTKLERVEYMFWSYIKNDSGYEHLGIGFAIDNNISFPNTFFFRQDNQYIINQKEVLPLSHFIKRPDKTIDFKIYWGNIRNSMSKTSHYKYLKKYEELYNYSVNDLTNESVLKIDNPDILRHYDLLRLDEVKKVYEPYIEDAKKWDNKTKRYLISIIDSCLVDLKPNEIKSKINEMSIKNSSCLLPAEG